MGEILFSYRSTNGAIAEQIFERLIYNCGCYNVRAEIRTPSQLTHDLCSYIEEFLRSYAVMAVLIDPTWARARGCARRLDDPSDFVCIEVAATLARGTPVLPFLVQGLELPSVDALPGELQTLSERQALAFGSEDTFHDTMMTLHRLLAIFLVQQEAPSNALDRMATAPQPARKDQLQEHADRVWGGKPPFEGVRINSLGEIRWIVGADHGELRKLYGERQFESDFASRPHLAVQYTG